MLALGIRLEGPMLTFSIIRSWFYPDPILEDLRYLRGNLPMLADDDRKFVWVMEQRRKAKLPFHEQHKERINALSERLSADMAW